MVTDAQVGLLRQKRMEKKTQETAAAAADMSVRSAQKWQAGALPSETKKARNWLTRPDAFAAVWASVIVPLLVADKKRVLEAKTLIDLLEEKRPGEFAKDQVRTLQRRMRDWRAVTRGRYGDDSEEYKQVGGTPRSQHKKPVRKAKAAPATGMEQPPPQLSAPTTTPAETPAPAPANRVNGVAPLQNGHGA